VNRSISSTAAEATNDFHQPLGTLGIKLRTGLQKLPGHRRFCDNDATLSHSPSSAYRNNGWVQAISPLEAVTRARTYRSPAARV
jgi:hypothetical protein